MRENCNNLVVYLDKHKYRVIYKDFTITIYFAKESYHLELDKR